MQGEDLNRVKQFQYLGLTVQADGGSEKEVISLSADRLGAWKKITGVMCDKKGTDKLKGSLYKVIVRPALLHGMETVAATKTQDRIMEMAELEMRK